VPLLAEGGATITLPNDFTNNITNSGINFAADANTPVISSGTWNLGANNLRLRNNGNTTSPLTLSGSISGAANLTLSANNNGTIILSGSNGYTGTTTITGPGGTGTGTTAVRLKLGAAGTIATSTGVVLAGGILDPGGFDHSMSVATLGLTANSTIDYVSGASDLEFANSSAVAWTAGTTLNLANWNSAIDKLRFGNDATGLTSTQLAAIKFNGAGAGTAQLDANGFVIAVAPSLPGDFNSDGKVDAADYVTWRKNSGTNNTLPNDGGLGVPIGPAHYNLWRNNFGNPPGAGGGGLGASAVPEPATIVLLMFGLAALVGRRRN
jgi:hypothetical protein